MLYEQNSVTDEQEEEFARKSRAHYIAMLCRAGEANDALKAAAASAADQATQPDNP